jgi:hypothetical protein
VKGYSKHHPGSRWQHHKPAAQVGHGSGGYGKAGFLYKSVDMQAVDHPIEQVVDATFLPRKQLLMYEIKLEGLPLYKTVFVTVAEAPLALGPPA